MIALTHTIRHVLRDRRGGTMTLTAILLPALIGIAGLSVDGANWYAKRQNIQSVADAAAVAGTYARLAGMSQSEIESTVLDEAQRNGFSGTSADIAVATDANGGVSVTLRETVPLYFLHLALPKDSMTVSARAVAGTQSTGSVCALALNESASPAFEVTGNADVNFGCGIGSNSTAEDALAIGGSGIASATFARAAGDIAVTGSGQLNTDSMAQPFSTPLDDPLSNLDPIPSPACDTDANGGERKGKGKGKGGKPGGGDATLTDSNGDGFITHCGDLKFKGSIDLQPGTYIIRNGDITNAGNTTVTGTDVTFMLTGDTPADVGRIHLNGNADFTLSAPTSGDLANVLFYQDRNASSPGETVFNGNLDLILDGMLYMPASAIRINGTALAPQGCFQIIADTILFTGNAGLTNDAPTCTSPGGDAGQAQVVRLVE